MPTYVIESSWSWDKSHTEYATLNLEEYDFDGNPITDLEDPECPKEHKQLIFRLFKEIAEHQSGYPTGSPLVAIHRVTLVEEKEGSGMKKVSFYLKPVFRFDQDGKPVPVRQ